jgi:hypothetical protein
MPAKAFLFVTIHGRDALTPLDIHPLWNAVEVVRVDAISYATEMVHLEPFWKGTVKVLIEPAVGVPCPTFQVKPAVPVRAHTGKLKPTSTKFRTVFRHRSVLVY